MKGAWIGYLLGLVALSVIVLAAIMPEQPFALNLLLAITGGLIGWTIGMLMTPVSSGEEQKFSEYGKALSTFVSGYLVAKLDKVFDLAVKDRADISALLVFRGSIFVAAFVLGALSTFVWRSYVSSQETPAKV